MGTRAKLTCGMLGGAIAGLIVVLVVFEAAFTSANRLHEAAFRARSFAAAVSTANSLGLSFDANKTSNIENSLEKLVSRRNYDEPMGLFVVGPSGAVIARHGAALGAPTQEIFHGLRSGAPWLQSGGLEYYIAPIVRENATFGYLIVVEEGLAASVDKIRKQARARVAIGFAGLLVAISIVGMIWGSRFVKPLHKMTEASKRYSLGDLSEAYVNSHGSNPSAPNSNSNPKDEIDILEKTFCDMSEAIQKQSFAMKKASSQALSSSTALSNLANELTDTAFEQVTSVTRSSHTARLVTETGQGTLENTRNIVRIAEESVKVAKEGTNAVTISVADISKLQARVKQICDRTSELLEKVRETNEVVSAVEEIAEQSTMLSVNASLEATRAGEAGKGFAVVAQEVATLAFGSKQATAQARDTLKAIHKAIEDLVKNALGSRSMAEAGMASIEHTGEIIRRLGEAISSTADAAKRIEQNATDQVAGLQQIDQAIDGIGRVAANNLDIARRTKEGCERLSSNFGQLDKLFLAPDSTKTGT